MPKNEQGVFHQRYQVIPRTLIFLTRQDEVLLLKGAPTKRLWPNRFNGVGGHIERGEDVATSARRELEEETGLAAQRLDLIGTVMVDVDRETGIALYVFRGEYGGGELRSSEEGELCWVKQDQIADLPLVEDLYVLLPRVLAARQGDAPFSVRYWYDENEKMKVAFNGG